MSVSLKLLDFPMDCCGMMQGSGFSEQVLEGTQFNKYWNKQLPVYRHPTKEDWKQRLEYLIDKSEGNRRNCAMIVLSADQKEIIAVAEESGFKIIQEFFNPNSNNMCYIMTYLHFANEKDYDDAWKEEDEEDEE